MRSWFIVVFMLIFVLYFGSRVSFFGALREASAVVVCLPVVASSMEAASG